MESPHIILSEIGQIAFYVTDLENSVGFYRDVLGIPFLFQVPNLAFFDCGGIRLMLTDQAEGDETQHPPSVLYFKVPDITRPTHSSAERE
jgi:catechol 2,3-dioxygenase-like lactoylglutathione lyase family enzyme